MLLVLLGEVRAGVELVRVLRLFAPRHGAASLLGSLLDGGRGSGCPSASDRNTPSVTAHPG
ncbi:hypothetical protein SSIG_07585 [Streptomyces filamentosus NRRL 11379]|nr:hypothetical protein SSIG_07585 [Streptomyces filamentosus NRRL 11379]